MIGVVIGLIAGGSLGTVMALFIIGSSRAGREQEAYMEGFLAGMGEKSEKTKD